MCNRPNGSPLHGNVKSGKVIEHLSRAGAVSPNRKGERITAGRPPIHWVSVLTGERTLSYGVFKEPRAKSRLHSTGITGGQDSGNVRAGIRGGPWRNYRQLHSPKCQKPTVRLETVEHRGSRLKPKRRAPERQSNCPRGGHNNTGLPIPVRQSLNTDR